MKISVAGAGAGKTKAMADKIIKLRTEMDDHMNIFCITFTNNAVACIEKKLKKYYGRFPDNIAVSTIHSFLYREFIKPYYFLLFNKQYERISTAELPQKVTYKAAKIRRLEESKILHQTVIPERAKWVLVKKTGDRKVTEEKRKIIRSVFKNYCGAVCIDEAQDIDSDMMEIIEVLDNDNIPLLLVGDPKQDLKGHKCLRQLMEKYANFVDYLNICHRCPQKHLELSNQTVAEQEQQYSDKKDGSIAVYFENDTSCNELMQEEKFDLSYISKKQDEYETHGRDKDRNIKIAIAEEIETVMRANHPAAADIAIRRASYYMAEQLLKNYESSNDKVKAMKTFKYNDRKAYGRIINILPDAECLPVKEKVFVNSIDSIKGQEGNNCLFILTTDLAAYLFGEKGEETTTKNKLYVALTRSLNKLTILVRANVEEKYGRDFISNFFNRYI